MTAAVHALGAVRRGSATSRAATSRAATSQAATSQAATTGTTTSTAEGPVAADSPTTDIRHLCHDLRQPLSAILLLAGALGAEGELPGRVRRHARQIEEQARWLADLVQQAVDQRRVTSAVEPVDPGEVARAAVTTIAPRFHGTLLLEVAEDTGWLAGDGVLLRRAVANLLDNAVRAAGDQGAVAVRAYADDDDCVVIEVEDSGPGLGAIPGGTRLGLSLVGSVMEVHGGTFAIDSGGILQGVRARLTVPRTPARG